MSKSSEDDQDAQCNDDSLAYEQAQAGMPAEDPLAAIKTMRLEQLAVCRLKTAEEMQAMRAETVQQSLKLSLEEIHDICCKALRACGVSELNAESIARAFVAAEADGIKNVGLSYFVDYLQCLSNGKINPKAVPKVSQTGAGSLLVEGDGGTTMAAFDVAFADFVEAAKSTGIAALSVKNVHACGVLGYFVERIAERGLVGQAYANAPAMVAPFGGMLPFFGTNPLAFAVPVAGRAPLVVDQSTSTTAYVNIRAAALRNQPIPDHWALNEHGQPTTDANVALAGTITPSGGYKGSNLALMVDVMSAGLSGSTWSHAAGSLTEGNEQLNLGQFFVAIDPLHFSGEDFYLQMQDYVRVLEESYGAYIPGSNRLEQRRKHQEQGVEFDQGLIDQIQGYIANPV